MRLRSLYNLGRKMEQPSTSKHAMQPLAARSPRIVISGGAGFIGSALVRELVQAGATVLVIDDLSSGRLARLPHHPRVETLIADAGEVATWRRACAQPWDAIVHLASVVGVDCVVADPERCRAENQRGFDALAIVLEDQGRSAGVWAASTSEVYAEQTLPLSESACLRNESQGRHAYAASKLYGEQRLAQATQGQATLLRFFNVVGPNQSAGQGMVLPRFVERARQGQALTIYGDGSAVRTFAHADEVARSLAWLVLRQLEGLIQVGGALNLGGAAVSSVLDMASEVQRCAGRVLGIEHLLPRMGEVHQRVPDLTRLRELGAPLPSMGLSEIVADTWTRHGHWPVSLELSTEEPACASLVS